MLRLNRMKEKPKKRKKSDCEEKMQSCMSSSESDTDQSSSKFEIFRRPLYVRQYPEDGTNSEYLVIIHNIDPNSPIGDRDLMALGIQLKKNFKGIIRFKRINKYKIGAIFERPGLANVVVNSNKTLLNLKIKAIIPASNTESIGVIRSVPLYLSNQEIYNSCTSSKEVVSVRRLTRKSKDTEGKWQITPTQTVALTFSSPILPTSIDINSWLFDVNVYIPPVMQCMRCMRFGHMGKYCRNNEKCSICGDAHSYKNCKVPVNDAKCCNCNGKHIAISKECSYKIHKINENKKKYEKSSYADLFNTKSFPELKKSNVSENNLIQKVIKSQTFMNSLINTIIKITSLTKTTDFTVNTDSITKIINENFFTKNKEPKNLDGDLNHQISKLN